MSRMTITAKEPDMENSISDYIGLVVLISGGGGAIWYFWPRIKTWWSDDKGK